MRFPPALATSFSAARDSDGKDLAAYLDTVERLGAASLYLTAGGPGAALAADPALLFARRGRLEVAAVDAALGAARAAAGASAGASQDAGRHGLRAAKAQPASLDRAEAETAVAVTKAALAFAAELGARHVVVSLGAAHGLARLWRGLRGRFLRGVLQYDDAACQDFLAARASLSRRHIDAALRSLDRIVEEAARRGLMVLLRNPRRPIELPAALELAALRAELRGAPLAPLLDLPAAHLASMMRCAPLRETVTAFGDGPLACLADACGTVGGLVPGQGEVDVAAVARALPEGAQRVFVPAAGLTLDEVAAGHAAVASL